MHKKTKNPPFPHRGRGLGGMGQENKLKAGLASDQNNRATQQGNAVAGQAGDKEGKPPTGHHSGRASRCPCRTRPPQGTPSAGIADTAAT